jgi:hypothetical protein
MHRRTNQRAKKSKKEYGVIMSNPTCGDIDGKPCKWHLTRDCPADRPDWHPSRSNQVCPPVAALLECRRDRDLYDRMGSFSYRSALEWKERAEKAQARIAELERELFVSQCSLKSADTGRQFDQARIEELEHKLYIQKINQSDYDDAVDRYESAEAERDNAQARILELERERDEATGAARKFRDDMFGVMKQRSDAEAERDRLRRECDQWKEAHDLQCQNRKDDNDDWRAELSRVTAERDRLREWAAAQPCDSVRLYGGLPIPPEYAKVTCRKCVPCQARAKLRKD